MVTIFFRKQDSNQLGLLKRLMLTYNDLDVPIIRTNIGQCKRYTEKILDEIESNHQYLVFRANDDKVLVSFAVYAADPTSFDSYRHQTIIKKDWYEKYNFTYVHDWVRSIMPLLSGIMFNDNEIIRKIEDDFSYGCRANASHVAASDAAVDTPTDVACCGGLVDKSYLKGSTMELKASKELCTQPGHTYVDNGKVMMLADGNSWLCIDGEKCTKMHPLFDKESVGKYHVKPFDRIYYMNILGTHMSICIFNILSNHYLFHGGSDYLKAMIDDYKSKLSQCYTYVWFLCDDRGVHTILLRSNAPKFGGTNILIDTKRHDSIESLHHDLAKPLINILRIMSPNWRDILNSLPDLDVAMITTLMPVNKEIRERCKQPGDCYIDNTGMWMLNLNNQFINLNLNQNGNCKDQLQRKEDPHSRYGEGSVIHRRRNKPEYSAGRHCNQASAQSKRAGVGGPKVYVSVRTPKVHRYKG